MLHMLHAKETGCKMIVVDPRFTRTAAKADEYVRIRSGSDIAFLFGVLHHIFKNGWEDKQYIHDRVYGMDKVREEVLEPNGRPTRSSRFAASRKRRCSRSRRPGREPARHDRLVHGPDAAHDRQRDSARVVHRCSSRSATSASPAAARTSSAATTTCRARPTSAPTPIRCRATTASPRALGSTSPRSGASTSSGSRQAVARPGMMIQARHDGVALDRRRAREERPDRPGPRTCAACSSGATRRTRKRAALEMKTAMDKLDLLVVVDPYPSATAAMAAMPSRPRHAEPEPGRLPAAGCDAVRDLGVRSPRRTARSSGARRSSSPCSSRAATT